MAVSQSVPIQRGSFQWRVWEEEQVNIAQGSTGRLSLGSLRLM